MAGIDPGFTSFVGLALLLAACASPLAAQEVGRSKLVVAPLFTQFYLREPVTFVLRNDGPYPVTLPNDAPWMIVNAQGRAIFSPLSLPRAVPLKPGARIIWRWDQRDDSGRQVAPGKYTAVFAQLKLRAILPIDAQMGSRGFFTFRFPGRTMLRVFMTDPQATRNAIENYYGLNAMSMPAGPLVDDRPQRSPYDSQWSWHFDPPRLRMVEAAIEACDASPQYVEDNLDVWLERIGSYCPWSARVQSLD